MRPLLYIAAALLAAHSASANPLTVDRRVLDNGLVVILHEDHNTPLVAVNTWYKVGSRDEDPGRTGFAHLFEHFMFEGSQHVPQGQYDANTNGRGGVNNATTSFDRTNYYAVVPAEDLEEALRLESDRMGFLRGAINPAALVKQQRIVVNELRERQNQPYGSAFEELCALVWPAGHGYGWTPGGAIPHVQAAAADEARVFHERFYNPNNAILAISGDHDTETTFRMVEKWFGGLPRGMDAPRPPLRSPERLGGRREKTVTDPRAQLPLLLLAFPVPPAGQPGSVEISAAASILGGGPTSRLASSLQRRRRVALSVSASLMGLHARDVLMIEAVPVPGVTLAELETAITGEIASMVAGGVQPRELSRVKAGLATARLRALEELQGFAESLAEGEAARGDPLSFDADIAALDAMAEDGPREAVRRWLTPDNLAVLRVEPAPAPAAGGPR
ncbi:MAG: pitrilysin family protein [Elusimicrobiota bacterium]|nr:pitrilysin family protein [Elusimicrobiota bacterium]